jgi:hypothetical protein
LSETAKTIFFFHDLDAPYKAERGERREEGGGREERGRDGPNFHVKAEPICV